jgi:hypothetical protein
MKNIFRFGRFILESVKDDIGELGWKEITLVDYKKGGREWIPLSKMEIDYIINFGNDNKFPDNKILANNSHINLTRGYEGIFIRKEEDDWFYVRFEFPYRPNIYFIVSQFEDLINLLEYYKSHIAKKTK